MFVFQGHQNNSPGCDNNCKEETQGTLGKVSNFCRSILARTSCGPVEGSIQEPKCPANDLEIAGPPCRILPLPSDGVKSRGSKQGEGNYIHRQPPWENYCATDANKRHDAPGGEARRKKGSHKSPHMPEDFFSQRSRESSRADSMIASRLFQSSGSLHFSQENIIDVGDLILDKQVGRGAFGRVYKATLHGETVALKIITHLASQPTIQVAPELDLLHGICHPNIVHVKGVLQGMEGTIEEEESMTYDARNSCVSSFFSDFARQLPEKNGGDANSDTWVIMEYCDQVCILHHFWTLFKFCCRGKCDNQTVRQWFYYLQDTLM